MAAAAAVKLSGFKIFAEQPRPPRSSGGLLEIERVNWDLKTDLLSIVLADAKGEVTIMFESPVSFRAQDEGDMLEYWGTRDAEGVDVASIYNIEKSAYLSEFKESGVSSFTCELQHWLIAGNNLCVEVIADKDDQPIIRVVERSIQ